MENIKEYVIGFVEGRVNYHEFMDNCLSSPEIYDWANSIAPEGMTVEKCTYNEKYQLIKCERVPYDIRILMGKGGSYPYTLGYALNLQGYLEQLLIKAFPDETVTSGPELGDLFDFILDAAPEYVDGPEIHKACIFEKIIETLPQGLSKTKRIKLFKEELKKVFYLEGKSYPHWVQAAEWPVSPSGKPMRFIGQKRRRGKEYENTLYTDFFFEDVDTGETRTVEQFT